jgi:hypothetical protein
MMPLVVRSKYHSAPSVSARQTALLRHSLPVQAAAHTAACWYSFQASLVKSRPNASTNSLAER